MEKYLDLLAQYGGWLTFVWILLNTSGLPLPGEIVMLAAGALAGARNLPIWRVFLPTFLGSLVGDHISFLLGRKGGRRILEAY